MRSFIGLVVVTLTVGCATEALDTSEDTQALGAFRCPDPSDCTSSNGGGVYTEEVGFAGYGTDRFMITTFINGTDSHGLPKVFVVGRGFNTSTGTWRIETKTLDHALLDNNTAVLYSVVAVSEWLTSPKIELTPPSGPHVYVTDAQMQSLALVMQENKSDVWTLSFGPREDREPEFTVEAMAYPMYWNHGTSVDFSARTDYCFRAVQSGSASADHDPVVFQQGINVNPITAQMGRNGVDVTLSCRHGAIARARSWGYTYRGDAADSLLFEAVMHMKRASYCGDETFYTRRDTDILINDNASPPVQNDDVNVSNLEARWGRGSGGRIRALCVDWSNPNNRRRSGAKYPPNSNGDLYEGKCFDGNGNYAFSIPTCEVFDAAGGLGAVVSDAAAP